MTVLKDIHMGPNGQYSAKLWIRLESLHMSQVAGKLSFNPSFCSMKSLLRSISTHPWMRC